MGEILEQVAAVSDQMVQYNLHREELLLLQATVLVNAGKNSGNFGRQSAVIVFKCLGTKVCHFGHIDCFKFFTQDICVFFLRGFFIKQSSLRVFSLHSNHV